MLRTTIFALVSILLVSCNDAGGGTGAALDPLPKVDASTPDRALKSYWDLRDWRLLASSRRSEAFANSSPGRDLQQASETVAVLGVTPKRMDSVRVEKFERSIVEVKTETESRAVAIVTIKNVTPVEPDEVVGKWETERREKGERYKYVLEKSGANWRVAEVYEFDTYGPEWRKQLPFVRNAPSLTYSGR